MKSRMWCALAVVGGMAVQAAAQQEYYRQDPSQSFSGFSSQDARNPGGLGWFSEVADDFTGQSGWSVNRMEFWGTYSTPSGSPGNIQGFTIRFYDDPDGIGAPATLLYEEDVMTFNQVEYGVFSGFAVYQYTIDLPTAFNITADGTYWVSIVGIIDRGGGSSEPQWFLSAAAAQSGSSAVQWFFSPGNFAPLGQDVGFVLANAGDECAADFDGDGRLSLADFVAFRNAYTAGDMSADFDGSGTLTLADFVAFRNAYTAGCP